jgi:hypothetical protein
MKIYETNKERKPGEALGESGKANLRSVDERGYEICNHLTMSCDRSMHFHVAQYSVCGQVTRGSLYPPS